MEVRRSSDEKETEKKSCTWIQGESSLGGAEGRTVWRTLQQWMKTSRLGTAPRKLLDELEELKLLDVLLPTREKILRLRMVATPNKELKVLLQRLKILLLN